MINYWWVTRPKRKLNTIPEILASVASVALNEEWGGDRKLHLELECTLEEEGIKRIGERRDQTGGGARTYVALLKSLGLIFRRNNSQKICLTLAGQDIIDGKNPVDILSHQILHYQYPSPFSTSRNVNVNPRFRLRPFIFLLKLLRDQRINYLSQEEIAKVVIVKAENESKTCYEDVVSRILALRNFGDSSLEKDFDILYAPSKGGRNGNEYGHLTDIANTFINWLDYTRLIIRDSSNITIATGKEILVDNILSSHFPFIERPEDEEFFQRKYGLGPFHKKDTRNLSSTLSITARMVEESRIKKAFISEALKRPIISVNSDLVETISTLTGCNEHLVEDVLNTMLCKGSTGTIDAFLSNYRDMAFCGRDEATDFEKATQRILEQIFKFNAYHVGPIGKTPDILVVSDIEGYLGIFDNKAYARYSISNDHHNRMVTNYIENISHYNKGFDYPLKFFSYIAGGFKSTIDSQLNCIELETQVKGSAISVDNFINLIKMNISTPISHSRFSEIFSIGREIHISDF